jgi:hypothetical protein
MVIATEELLITSMNFPPYCTRQATQTLTPIGAISKLARTVNGDLLDLSDAIFKQFGSVISCTDFQIPEFAWPGTLVTVNCIIELGYKTSGGTQIRTPVGGSPRVDGDYTFYRPQLSMRVVGWTDLRNDWTAQNSWTLTLEEASA